MGGRTYEFRIPEGRSAEDLLGEARARASRAGITLKGDAHSGTFTGSADGEYTVSGHTLRLEVRSKPALVPWALVEGALRSLFG